MKIINNPRRWYWMTLRLNKKRGHWWSRGTRATVITTTRCPFGCDYCPMYIYGSVKRYDESTFEEWKVWFERFPEWISQVYVSGGEPSLYKDIVPLVNWLVQRGHHVIVYTNLWKIENFTGIKPHWRLIFFPTFHETEDTFERFSFALKQMEKTYLVTSAQIGVNPNRFTKIKHFFSRDWFLHVDDGFQFAPDTPRTLRIWSGCVEMYRDDKTFKPQKPFDAPINWMRYKENP